MKNKLIHLIILFSLTFFYQGCSKTQTPPPKRLFPVRIDSAKQQDVPVYVEAIGNVYAAKTVDIRPQVTGTIIEIAFDGGDDVEVGQVLYRIDPVPYQLALEQAESALLKNIADLNFAKKKVERYSALIKSNFVSKLSIEEYQRDVAGLEGQLLASQAAVSIAKTNLNYCVIVSPLAGRVSITKTDVGNIVSPADLPPMTTVLQITPINIKFSIAQREFEFLQKLFYEGDRQFEVILPGTSQTFNGEIVAVDNQVDLRTGTIQIKGVVSNREKILWPGEFVRVRVFIRLKKDAIVVPAEAVQIGQKGSYVYTLNPDQTVDLVYVKPAEAFEKLIVIDEGLTVGQKIVTDGQINLKQGVAVQVISDRSEPAEATQKEPSIPGKQP